MDNVINQSSMTIFNGELGNLVERALIPRRGRPHGTVRIVANRDKEVVAPEAGREPARLNHLLATTLDILGDKFCVGLQDAINLI